MIKKCLNLLLWKTWKKIIDWWFTVNKYRLYWLHLDIGCSLILVVVWYWLQPDIGCSLMLVAVWYWLQLDIGCSLILVAADIGCSWYWLQFLHLSPARDLKLFLFELISITRISVMNIALYNLNIFTLPNNYIALNVKKNINAFKSLLLSPVCIANYLIFYSHLFEVLD